MFIMMRLLIKDSGTDNCNYITFNSNKRNIQNIVESMVITTRTQAIKMVVVMEKNSIDNHGGDNSNDNDNNSVIQGFDTSYDDCDNNDGNDDKYDRDRNNNGDDNDDDCHNRNDNG